MSSFTLKHALVFSQCIIFFFKQTLCLLLSSCLWHWHVVKTYLNSFSFKYSALTWVTVAVSGEIKVFQSINSTDFCQCTAPVNRSTLIRFDWSKWTNWPDSTRAHTSQSIRVWMDWSARRSTTVTWEKLLFNVMDCRSDGRHRARVTNTFTCRTRPTGSVSAERPSAPQKV